MIGSNRLWHMPSLYVDGHYHGPFVLQKWNTMINFWVVEIDWLIHYRKLLKPRIRLAFLRYRTKSIVFSRTSSRLGDIVL